jgi:vancomycin resistance protein VanJ
MGVKTAKFRIGFAKWCRTYAAPLTYVAAVVTGAATLWLVGWALVGDGMLIVRWGAYAAPWLALSVLAAAGLFGLVRRPWAAVVALAVGLLILSPVLTRFNPLRWSPDKSSGGLKVMTFNTSDLNLDIEAIAGLIGRERPDIVFLQQIADLKRLQQRLAAQGYRYTAFPEHTDDTVILSRFPLSQSKSFGTRTTSVAAVGGCKVRLWSLHAPHGQFTIDEQTRYFDLAADALRDETLPLIVAGDFNSTEFNTVQAPLRVRLRDAYAETGSGFGFTFPSDVRRMGTLGKLFRIDHILFRDLAAQAAWVADDNAGSDHFAVVAILRLAQYCR